MYNSVTYPVAPDQPALITDRSSVFKLMQKLPDNEEMQLSFEAPL